MTVLENERKADDIIALFQKYGGDAYYGEPVTQLQHACQAATWARTEGYSMSNFDPNMRHYYPQKFLLDCFLTRSSLWKG